MYSLTNLLLIDFTALRAPQAHTRMAQCLDCTVFRYWDLSVQYGENLPKKIEKSIIGKQKDWSHQQKSMIGSKNWFSIGITTVQIFRFIYTFIVKNQKVSQRKMKRLIIYDRKSRIQSKNWILKTDQLITIKNWFFIGITVLRMFYTINWLQPLFRKKPRLWYRFAHFLRRYVEWSHWCKVVWRAFIMELLSKFTLELNAAKIINYNKKWFK